MEIGSTYITDKKTCSYITSKDDYKGNIHFDDNCYPKYLNEGYPVLKIKKLYFGKYDIFPEDFDPEEYKNLHIDLKHMKNNEAIEHFAKHGFLKEGFTKKVKKWLYLSIYISILKF